MTEYAHETRPGNSIGIAPELQATFAAEALDVAAQSLRVRLFVWFIFRDSSENPWRSGVLAQDGTPKPAFASFSDAAQRLDGRNPVLPVDAEVARIPVLELAYYTEAGDPVEVRLEGRKPFSVPLRDDGWLDVPVEGRPGAVRRVRAIDAHGHSVNRVLRFEPSPVELHWKRWRSSDRSPPFYLRKGRLNRSSSRISVPEGRARGGQRSRRSSNRRRRAGRRRETMRLAPEGVEGALRVRSISEAEEFDSSPRWRSVMPPTVFEGAIRQRLRKRAALAGPTFGNASRRS